MLGLGIWEGDKNPPLNSNLIFELFKDDNSNNFLNIFYNN